MNNSYCLINENDITYYSNIKQQLLDISLICDNVLNLSPYGKECLFLKVFKIYLISFNKDKFKECISDIDYILEKASKEYFFCGKLILELQEKLDNIEGFTFDLSELNQYMLIFKTYNTLIQDSLNEVLESVENKEDINILLSLKEHLKNTFDSNQIVISQREDTKYLDDFKTYSEQRFIFISKEINNVLCHFK